MPRRSILMVGGVPGSGKSSFIDRAIAPDVTIISADDCRGAVQESAGISKSAYAEECIPLARKLFLRLLNDALVGDQSIVVDAAYLTDHSRNEIAAWALAAEYNTACVFIRASLMEIHEGNTSRARTVDPEAMSKFIQDWEKVYHSNEIHLVNGHHCFNVIMNREASEEAQVNFGWNGGAYLEVPSFSASREWEYRA